jgi:DNA-binding response OmpR family regulator
MKILVVDDERAVRESLLRALALEGYDVDLAADGEEALESVRRAEPDALILDVLMPGVDGLEVSRRLRRSGSKVPILMLTARDAIENRVEGLDAGADDYVTKPFGMDELLARLRAALRRAQPETEPVLQVGDLEIDLEKQAVRRNGSLLQLTPHEFRLLRLFALNEGKLLTQRKILSEVWGAAYQTESHYLHVYVSQLRRKIEPDAARPRYLLTETGVGYRFVAPKS